MFTCRGTTSKGINCNRVVKGEDFCWQHQKCAKLIKPTPTIINSIINSDNDLIVRRPEKSAFLTTRNKVARTILPKIEKDICLVPDHQIITFDVGQIITNGLILMLSAYSVTDSKTRPLLFNENLSAADRIVDLIISDLNLDSINKFYDGNIVRIAFKLEKVTKPLLRKIVDTFGPSYLNRDIKLNATHDLYLELETIEFYENGSVTNLLDSRC